MLDGFGQAALQFLSTFHSVTRFGTLDYCGPVGRWPVQDTQK